MYEIQSLICWLDKVVDLLEAQMLDVRQYKTFSLQEELLTDISIARVGCGALSLSYLLVNK